jgi:hypothetical protein
VPRLIASSAEVARGLAAASLLARGDARGAALLPDDAAAAWRSFFAMVLCLPAFLALSFLGAEEDAVPDGARTLAAEIAGYVAAWAAFALASWPVAQALGREAEWPRFLSAWNWSNIVQYAVLLLALGLPFPAPLATVLGLAAFLYAVWLEWFTVRAALGVAPLAAAAVVLLDLIMGLFFGSLSSALG